MAQAKRPTSGLLTGPYGHPFHPILVTIPIGAWTSSLIFDIASYVVDRPAFLIDGARWLIAIGVIGALAAAMAGLLDFFAIPATTPARRTAVLHLALNLTVTAAYIANFSWRQNLTSETNHTPSGPLSLSVVSVILLAVSGYLGGKLAYRFGVRVAEEATQAEGYRSDAPTS